MGRILRHPEKLSTSYFPDFLPHREDEVEKIRGMFLPGTANMRIQVTGPAGSGKTASSMLAVKGLDAALGYLNMRILRTKFNAYRSLVEQTLGVNVPRGMHPSEMLAAMLKDPKPKIVIVDEVDYYITSTGDTSLIYDLTRLPELESAANIPGVIFIFRSEDWKKQLDAAARSSLGAIVIRLERYTLDELVDIVRFRAEQALAEGATPDEVIEYIAEVVDGQFNGDVRYALDILYYSARLAETRERDVLGLDEVREVVSQLVPITSEDFSALQRAETVALLALAYALRDKAAPSAPFTEVYRFYKELSKEAGLKADIRSLEIALQNLVDMGLIASRGPRKLSLDVPVEKLITFLEEKLHSK